MQIVLEMEERGRGSSITSNIFLNADGTPRQINNTGHDHFKNPVTEQFLLSNDTATWRNSAEQGSRDLSSPAFYLSMTGTPEEVAMLARALLKVPGNTLPLLPEGEARLERAGELKLNNGGATLNVTQYNISGLDFSPVPIWLDDQQRLFAATLSTTASGSFSVIRVGWESSQSSLFRAQGRANELRYSKQVETLAHKPRAPLVFTNANLFDSETGIIRENSTVVIIGNRIRAVGPDRLVRIPAGAEVVNAQGKFLMPGMWDTHEHMEAVNGMLDIAAGVTTVRDLGNDTQKLLILKSGFDRGVLIGPRVMMAGLVEGRNHYAAATKDYIDTEQEAKKAIDKYARLGYVQIKIYSSVKPELVPKIVSLAHARGLRVSGHVPAFMSARQFVEAGVDEIQHINFLFLNFMLDTVKETNTPLRLTAVAERGWEIELESKQVESLIELLRKREIVIEPTLNAFEVLFLARNGSIPPSFAAVADRLPPQVRRSMLVNSGLKVPEGKAQRFQESFQALLKMVGLLHKAGVHLAIGTDWLSGFSFHRELELFVAAGIPSHAVLQYATIGAARIMRRDQHLGSIAVGKLADMILIDGNPSRQISDIRRVELVVKDGVVFESKAIQSSLGIRPD